MKPVQSGTIRWILLLALPVLLTVIAGCSSTDPENQASRPWGAPKGWETGLPSSMTEGR
jgi:hypothetical protein